MNDTFAFAPCEGMSASRRARRVVRILITEGEQKVANRAVKIPWRPAGVRARLTLWYVGAVAIVVGLHALMVFAFLRNGLWRSLDEALYSEVETAESLLDRERNGAVVWKSPPHLEGEDEGNRVIEVWSADATRLLLRVPDHDDDDERGAPRSGLPPPSRIERSHRYESLVLADGSRMRTLTGRDRVEGEPLLIRAARSEEPLRRELRDLALVLGLASPAALGAAGLGGYLLARRALAPVDRIADRARSITADHLHERIPVENPGDVLGRLAIVLNDTLARLDDAFARLKRFTADASHELRTPLTASRSVGEVGLQERHDEEGYRAVIGGIARWAVEANGGRIALRSREGEGSIFRIVFPLVLVMLAGGPGAGAVAQEHRQEQARGVPTLTVGVLPDTLTIDGALSEPAWLAAQAADAFTQTDPSEGAPPSGRTIVRVLANAKALVVGIVCEDPAPDRIVSFSVRRDAPLESEDHVSVVLGPFLDGRSGYVFAINPSGARYDGLIEPGGEDENADWDGIWEAATMRLPTGWSAELRIPVQTVSFKPGLREWHFNVQRRVQRLLETTRWASPVRQYQVTQTSRAGLLAGLPEFDVGLGLSVRPALTTGGGLPARDAEVDGEFQPSVDVTQRLGANLLASLTVNTDFAETEVDTRRTNLTRFPLFFPEKRTFFLEGSDIFSFGLGLDEDIIPFFSRRVGLVEGSEVPILAGGKINGRIADTNVGALVVGTNDKAGVAPARALMTAARVKQNIWEESWVGALVTTGDPLGRDGSWLAGADFTYATSRFRGDKNFLVGVWGLATDRRGLGSDATAHGLKIDYPNDLWDVALRYKRIGRNFDPSLGFVPRRAVSLYELSVENETRIARGPLQLLEHEFGPWLATDLSGRWESYEVWIAPVNWRFRSGDRVELDVNPMGERLVEPFEVADDVLIGPGAYHWRRYRLEVETAQKRRLYAQVAWWFGDFYDGRLDQIEWTGAWNPTPLLTVEISGERNVGDLPSGRFRQTLTGTRLRVNVSPDLSVSSYVQYDTDSDSIGVNTRLRWTFLPVADLFVVYNHNVRSLLDRWQLDSNQLLVKLQYTWRP